jgi:hypothetical protein
MYDMVLEIPKTFVWILGPTQVAYVMCDELSCQPLTGGGLNQRYRVNRKIVVGATAMRSTQDRKDWGQHRFAPSIEKGFIRLEPIRKGA